MIQLATKTERFDTDAEERSERLAPLRRAACVALERKLKGHSS